MNLLEARALNLWLGQRHILQNIDLVLQPGTFLGVVGPNGAGKSTLARLLARLQAPSAGSLHWQGQAAEVLSLNAWARSVGYLPQNAEVHWPIAVERVVQLGREPYRGSAAFRDPAPVEQAMRQAEVDHLRQRRADQLSGGERLRVLLARVFAGQPTLIIADEPLAGLDPYHQLHMMELLQAHARAGGAVIAILHELHYAARFCDRILMLDAGRLAAEGTPAEVLNAGMLECVFGVSSTTIQQDGELAVLPWRRAREHS